MGSGVHALNTQVTRPRTLAMTPTHHSTSPGCILPISTVTHTQNSQMHTYTLNLMMRYIPHVTYTHSHNDILSGASWEQLSTRTRLSSYMPGYTPMWPIKSSTCWDFYVLFPSQHLPLGYMETPYATKCSLTYTHPPTLIPLDG